MPHRDTCETWLRVLGPDRAAPVGTSVRVGRVAFEFQDGTVRRLTCGGVEIFRHLYFAVRQDDWDTVPPRLLQFSQVVRGEAFHASFQVECRKGLVHYLWQGNLDVSARELCYRVRGRPVKTFGSNRIGLCLLLPVESLAGRPFQATVGSGSVKSGAFTSRVDPHLVTGACKSLRWEPDGGPAVEATAEGSTFEVEDQRNWGDVTYKAYAPLPYAYSRAEEGLELEQAVRISFGDVGRTITSDGGGDSGGDVVQVAWDGEGGSGVVPGIGLNLDRRTLDHEPGEIDLLRRLRLAHLRLDIGAAASAEAPTLDGAARLARAVGTRLDLVVTDQASFAGPDMGALLTELQDVVGTVALHSLEGPVRGMASLRSLLRSRNMERPVGGPATLEFASFNQNRDWIGHGPDFVLWAMSPAVHQDDEATLMENPEALLHQIEAARAFSGSAALEVGPIHFAPLWPRSRPDGRQSALFGAAWTVLAIRALALGKARAASFFGTAGAGGVLHRREPFPQPVADDLGAQVHPAYHVLRDFSHRTGSALHGTHSADPLAVQGAGVTTSAGRYLWLVNRTPRSRTVAVSGIPSGETRLCLLDESLLAEAARVYGASLFDRQGRPVDVGAGTRIVLKEYAVARLGPF